MTVRTPLASSVAKRLDESVIVRCPTPKPKR